MAADLSQENLRHSLLTFPEFHAAADTLFIAEGLLMYLRAEMVDGIFRIVRHHAGARSRFAFTFLEPQAGGRVNFRNVSRWVDLWLRLRGETFLWGIRCEELPRYLETRGFRPRDLATADTFRHRYLQTDDLRDSALAEGECLCVAEYN